LNPIGDGRWSIPKSRCLGQTWTKSDLRSVGNSPKTGH
jgi:hypothetical protein